MEPKKPEANDQKPNKKGEIEKPKAPETDQSSGKKDENKGMESKATNETKGKFNPKLMELASRDKNMDDNLKKLYKEINDKLESKEAKFEDIKDKFETFKNLYSENRAEQFFIELKNKFNEKLNLYCKNFLRKMPILNASNNFDKSFGNSKMMENEIQKMISKVNNIRYNKTDDFISNFEILNYLGELERKINNYQFEIINAHRIVMTQINKTIFEGIDTKALEKITPILIEKIKKTIDDFSKLSYFKLNDYVYTIQSNFIKIFKGLINLEKKYIDFDGLEKAKKIFQDNYMNYIFQKLLQYKDIEKFDNLLKILKNLRNEEPSKDLNYFYKELFSVFDALEKLFLTNINDMSKNLKYFNEYTDSDNNIKDFINSKVKPLIGDNNLLLSKSIKEINEISSELLNIVTIGYFNYLKKLIIEFKNTNNIFWSKLFKEYKNNLEVTNITGDVEALENRVNEYLNGYLNIEKYLYMNKILEDDLISLEKLLNSKIIA